jgi:hypothetical protein
VASVPGSSTQLQLEKPFKKTPFSISFPTSIADQSLKDVGMDVGIEFAYLRGHAVHVKLRPCPRLTAIKIVASGELASLAADAVV